MAGTREIAVSAEEHTIDLEHACVSDIGLVRKLNEDAYCADEGLGLWAVFDGMGGHGSGDVAAGLAVTTVRECVTQGSDLASAFLAAHKAILDAAARGGGAESMGCTAVAVRIQDDEYELCWIGDSRCYLLDNDSALWQLSNDHSLVQQLIDDGIIDDEEAARHPDRHVVSQCLGDQKGTPTPETLNGTLQPGQRLMLCSDGLCGEVPSEAIERILREQRVCGEAARALVEAANAAGGVDNTTVALIDYGKPGQAPRKSARRPGKTRGGGAPSAVRGTRAVTTAHASRGHKLRYFALGLCGALVVLAPLLYVLRATPAAPVPPASAPGPQTMGPGSDAVDDTPEAPTKYAPMNEEDPTGGMEPVPVDEKPVTDTDETEAQPASDELEAGELTDSESAAPEPAAPEPATDDTASTSSGEEAEASLDVSQPAGDETEALTVEHQE